jgi:hypothetical protein
MSVDLKSLGLEAKLDTPIEVVAQSIMIARCRTDNDGSIITRLLGVGSTVRAFTTLTEERWNSLDLPLMMRIYLRSVADNAAINGIATPKLTRLPSDPQPDLNYVQRLECDFNMGLALNLELYGEMIEQCCMFGFSREDAVEAIIVTSCVNADRAVDFLLKSEGEKVAMRIDAVAKQGRSVPHTQHHTLFNNDSKSSSSKTTESAALRGRVPPAQEDFLRRELLRLQDTIKEEQIKRQTLEKSLEQKIKFTELQSYREYIRGLIVDGVIDNAELVQLENYRRERGITELQHATVLRDLNISAEQFKALIPDTSESTSNEMECTICMENRKDHMVMDCMHLCVCEKCAEDVLKEAHPKCPLCSGQIREIRKIFL